MKNIILFDPVEARAGLLPLTLTRPVALLRHGITTLSEKWQKAIPGTYSYSTQDYLSIKYPMIEAADGDNLFIAGNLHPDRELVEAILSLEPGEALTQGTDIIARRGNGETEKPRHMKAIRLPSTTSGTSSCSMTKPCAATSPA